MKTIEVKDKTLLIGEREKPQIGDHEVLIKVKASGINRADIAQKHQLSQRSSTQGARWGNVLWRGGEARGGGHVPPPRYRNSREDLLFQYFDGCSFQLPCTHFRSGRPRPKSSN